MATPAVGVDDVTLGVAVGTEADEVALGVVLGTEADDVWGELNGVWLSAGTADGSTDAADVTVTLEHPDRVAATNTIASNVDTDGVTFRAWPSDLAGLGIRIPSWP